MSTRPFTEFESYSPVHDADMVRISMCNDKGGEYFVLIPSGGGKRYRARREEALDAIDYAIDHGMEPGMVRYESVA